MALKVNKKYDENKKVWVIEPVGEIDIYTTPKFREILLGIIDEKEADIIIDGTYLDYIDSTGLGVLISGLKKIKEKDRNITIVNIKPSIKKLFELTGLNKVFVVKE